MTEKDKARLLELGQQLSTLGTEFRIAQIGLEKAVEAHGLSSPEAREASDLCSLLAMRFSEAEEGFLALKER
ncbi:hypothetical protein D7V91_02640 [bacterium 1xD42-67]|nr:hypothetical protein D7V91_02640 [bacterium 1xD42-67]